MAILKFDTFPADTEGAGLLKKVRQAMTNLSGHGPAKDGTFLNSPKGLNAERDMLRENFREIWQNTVVQYRSEETGASVNHRTKIISLGEFFLKPDHKVFDIQKVILHEYLHLAINIEMREFHHGQMTQIITYNLGYPGDANPFGTD